MRELNIGGTEVRVRATPLALLFYKQEFKSDLIGDLVKMQDMVNDPSKLDTVQTLQLIWAMAKADAYGDKFPSFVQWVSTLESIDLTDSSFLVGALEEARDGFFRGGVKGAVK